MIIKLNEGLSRNAVAEFISDSVESLEDGFTGTCRYPLDNDLALYVGWSDGFEPDNGHDGYEICAKIGTTHETLWSDYDFIDMPQSTINGEVWDTDISNPTSADASWFINQYNEIKNAVDRGEVTVTGV